MTRTVLVASIALCAFGVRRAVAPNPQASDERLRTIALRVSELDRQRQLPSASQATVDSLLAFYSDSVVYEHPGVGAIVRGKAALRAGMVRFLGSVQSHAGDVPRIV